jgi:hypothetical protein
MNTRDMPPSEFDDLIAAQEEFLRSEMKPSARVVRRSAPTVRNDGGKNNGIGKNNNSDGERITKGENKVRKGVGGGERVGIGRGRKEKEEEISVAKRRRRRVGRKAKEGINPSLPRLLLPALLLL